MNEFLALTLLDDRVIGVDPTTLALFQSGSDEQAATPARATNYMMWTLPGGLSGTTQAAMIKAEASNPESGDMLSNATGFLRVRAYIAADLDAGELVAVAVSTTAADTAAVGTLLSAASTNLGTTDGTLMSNTRLLRGPQDVAEFVWAGPGADATETAGLKIKSIGAQAIGGSGAARTVILEVLS